MYMYIISGQNSHNSNESSIPKSTPCELSVTEHFSIAHNRIGICRPRQTGSTHVLSLSESFIPKQVSCSLVRVYHGTHLVLGGIPG